MLVDTEGKIVTASTDDQLNLEFIENGSVYSPRFDAVNNLRSKLGVFNLTDVIFIGEPGSNVTLSLSSPYIQGDLQLADPSYNLTVLLSFRNCSSG